MINPTLSTYFITQDSDSHTNICHSLIEKLETYSVATSLETQLFIYEKSCEEASMLYTLPAPCWFLTWLTI
jgi:hypothetical protein